MIANLNLWQFPPDALKAICTKRWDIETSFRSLKYTVGLIHLHSKIPMLILLEVFAAFLVFNFAKAISWGIEMPQEPQKRRRRLNFYLPPLVKNPEALLCRKCFPIRLGGAFPRRFFPGNRISCFYVSSRWGLYLLCHLLNLMVLIRIRDYMLFRSDAPSK